MNKYENNVLAREIRKKITSGDFKEKQELIEYLKKLSNIVREDPVLMQVLKEEGIVINDGELNEISRELLEYYDKSKTDITSLNLDGISQFEIGDTDYIKIKNEDGTYDVLDDSMNDKNFVEQMQERQNKSVDLQNSDGIKNKQEIIKDMKEDKKEATLTASTNVDVRELTPEERRQFMAVMRMHDADEINFVVDPVRNIYINRDTGETYYVNKNQFNQMEVRKIEEATAQTIKEEKTMIDEDGASKNVSIENPSDADLENLSEFDLQFIVDNKFDSLTPEQKQVVMDLLARKQEMKSLENKPLTNQNKIGGRQYVKKMMNQPYNGFTSILLLSLITLLFGAIMVGNILFKIKI